MNDTWDDDDRAIARALDAEPPDAGPSPPVDDTAVAEYREVLAHLPFEAVAPRAGLEDEVLAAARARRRPTAIAFALERRRAARRRVLAVAAVAAAAVVVALAIVMSRPAGGGSRARIEPTAASDSPAHVLARPGTRRADLRTATGLPVGRVALATDGQGYLYDLDLPQAGGHAAWLWLDTASGPVRVGAVPGTATVHFVVRREVAAVDGVLVTSESAAEPHAPGPPIATGPFGAS